MINPERVKINVSDRESKRKDGDIVKVRTNGEIIGETIFSDYNYLLDNQFVSQEELNVLGSRMYLILQQKAVRDLTKTKTPSQLLSSKIKTKNLTPEQIEKILNYIDKQ